MMEQTERDILAKRRTILASERTVLAAERTFSAWIRTGLTGMAGGLAILRLNVFFFEKPHQQMIAKYVGAFLILWGIGIFLFALWRYHNSCKKLKIVTGFEVATWWTTCIVIGLVISAWVLLYISIS